MRTGKQRRVSSKARRLEGLPPHLKVNLANEAYPPRIHKLPEQESLRPRPKILLGVTVAASLMLMRGFPEYLESTGWEVHLVCSPGTRLEALTTPGIHTHALSMSRRPDPLRDIASLVRWLVLLRRIRPDVTAIGTPKASLLGNLAAAAMRVPSRVYILRGLRSEMTRGITQKLLNVAERVACACVSDVVCVSPSLREVARKAKLTSDSKLRVLGPGSSNGVDSHPDLLTPAQRRAVRDEYFPQHRWPIIGYIGRVSNDKGLETLAESLSILTSQGRVGDCVIIGGDDAGDSGEIRKRLNTSGWRLVHLGHVEEVGRVAQVMDVLCLPSLREGFPNVVLEAAALGIPCIGSDATGVVDSIIDGQTGIIFRRGDAASLAAKIRTLTDNPDLVTEFGVCAQQHVRETFDHEVIWPVHERFYRRLLSNS